MASLSLLFAVLLVYIPRARDQARSIQCQNNLKWLGISLHNYHDTYMTLPIGSRGAGYTQTNPTATQDYASSWHVALIPFGEQRGVVDLWDDEGHNGFDAGTPPSPNSNMQLVNDFVPDWFHCPSSPLPELVLIGKHGTPDGRVLPTYAGVAGGVTESTWSYHDSTRLQVQTGNAQGILASNGSLLANESVRFKDIRDGTAFTMMVAEQSDYHRLAGKPIMAHSGGTVGAWCGAKGNGIVGQNATATNPIAWNLTTIRYPVQHKRHATLPPGIFGPSNTTTLGNNNGIFSVHRGGAYAALADASVKFLSEDTDLKVLVYMSIRDDEVE